MVNFVKEQVKNIKAYTVESNRPPIMLDANENPHGLPVGIVKKVLEGIDYSSLNRYPDARATLLCQRLAEYIGHGIDGDMVMAGDGSDELINIIISAFLSKGDSILLPFPGFAMYNIYSMINEGNIISFKRDEDFNLDIDGLIGVLDEKKPKLTILCNPNNPTGTLTPVEDIVKLLENSNSMIVIDEAYFEFAGVTAVNLVRKYDNLIILRTLSKAWGMAGLRLGYLISNKSVIDELLKVKAPFNVNTITQEAARIALDFQDVMRERVSQILEERDYLLRELNLLNNIKIFESHANFLFLEVPDSNYLCGKLREDGIAIRGFNNSQGISNFVRITVGTREENEKLVDKFKVLVGE